MWVTIWHLYTLSPIPKPSPSDAGLAGHPVSSWSLDPAGRTAGVRSPNPTPFLRNRLGKERRGRKCGNSPGGRSPAQSPSLGSYGTLCPALGPAAFCSRQEEPGHATPVEAWVSRSSPATEVSRHHPLLPFSNGSVRGSRRPPRRQAAWGLFHWPSGGGCSRGAGPGRHGNRPESAGGTEGGATPGVSPRHPY